MLSSLLTSVGLIGLIRSSLVVFLIISPISTNHTIPPQLPNTPWCSGWRTIPDPSGSRNPNLGDMTDAAKDLNIIRARAGLPPSSQLTSSSNLQQADSAILHEEQTELFTEWGHRWFDLNRTGAVTILMGSPGNVYQYKNNGMETWNSGLAVISSF